MPELRFSNISCRFIEHSPESSDTISMVNYSKKKQKKNIEYICFTL